MTQDAAETQRATRAPRVYLAGPGVFRPDPWACANRLRRACAEAGLEGVFPLDATAPDGLTGRALAAWIRTANLALIRGCDAVLADMTPFRGPGMDGGTAYEMGFAAALSLPVFAWTEDASPDYAARVPSAGASAPGGARRCAAHGWDIEDFGLADNLMMACGTADGRVHRTPGDAAAALARTLRAGHPQSL